MITLFHLLLSTSLLSYAGPSVTGGVGDFHVLVECTNPQGDRFSIWKTPVPRYFQGSYHLSTGEHFVLACHPESELWACQDLHLGAALTIEVNGSRVDSTLRAEVKRSSLSSAAYDSPVLFCEEGANLGE